MNYQSTNKNNHTEKSENSLNDSQKPTISKKEYNTSEVIMLNRKYVVQVICQTSDGVNKGSGVVIGRDQNDELIVLTNYHVIENYKIPPAGVPPCAIMAQTPDWSEYYYSEPTFGNNKISKDDMELIDFAFLTVKAKPKIKITMRSPEDGSSEQVEQTTNLLSLSEFPKICSIGDQSIGKEVVVLGYPAIGGIPLGDTGITTTDFIATEGIISESMSNSDWFITTSAKIDQGNSGGGAFVKPEGCLLGMPTFAINGMMESLGRLLNLPKLKEEYFIKVLDN